MSIYFFNNNNWGVFKNTGTECVSFAKVCVLPNPCHVMENCFFKLNLLFNLINKLKAYVHCSNIFIAYLCEWGNFQ